jgi:hypothetical protein
VTLNFSLKTNGMPMKLNFGYVESNQLNSQDFCDLQCSSNLTSNQVNAVASMVRKKIGRHVIEPNLRENISIMGKRLDDYFKSYHLCFFETMTMTSKKLVPITRPLIVVNNLNGLLQEIAMVRSKTNNGDLLYKLGMDGGHGFFKICLNILNPVSENEEPAKTFASGATELLSQTLLSYMKMLISVWKT